MPQKGVKHEVFALLSAKDLQIFGFARHSSLWITLCTKIFYRINIISLFIMCYLFYFVFNKLNINTLIFKSSGDNLFHVDITLVYFSILV